MITIAQFTYHEIQSIISKDILSIAPRTTVEIHAGPESDYEIVVEVFNTPKRHIRRISKIITDMDWFILRRSSYSLIPMIKNRAVTKKYYPKYYK